MTATALAVVAAIGRVLLAFILGRAALHKLRERSRFAAQVRAYRLLPAMLVAPVAVTLTIVEASTAVALLKWNTAALMAAALFAAYACAMAINLVRGRTDLDCGCGGPLAARTTIDWTLVARNAALIAIALLGSAGPTPRLVIADYLLVLAGSASAILLYEAAEQAMANRQRVQVWKESRPWKP